MILISMRHGNDKEIAPALHEYRMQVGVIKKGRKDVCTLVLAIKAGLMRVHNMRTMKSLHVS